MLPIPFIIFWAMLDWIDAWYYSRHTEIIMDTALIAIVFLGWCYLLALKLKEE